MPPAAGGGAPAPVLGLHLQQAGGGVFQEPVAGLQVVNDLQGPPDNAVALLQVARARGEGDGELGARRACPHQVEAAEAGSVVPARPRSGLELRLVVPLQNVRGQRPGTRRRAAT